jgi:single-strand DNA-binding protein
VEGRLQTRTWDDKEGNKRYTTEVVANQVVFLSGGGERGERPAQPAGAGGAPRRDDAPPPPAPDFGGGAPDDDVPF